tara:strand:+ start:95 stop:1183 length:1089 start_codon:yes stop_codon:yes gene_type:complete
MNKKSTLEELTKSFIGLSLLGIALGVLMGSFFKVIENNKSNKEKRNQEIYPLKHKNTPSEINRNIKNQYFLRKDIKNKFKYKSSAGKLLKLSAKWKEIISQHKDIEVSAFLMMLDTNKYAEIEADNALPAGSTIKIPILLLILQMLDRGEINWDELIDIEESLKGGGAGWMAYEPIGKKFPIHEVANEMIRISDNTAANLLIKRIGGISSINKKLSKLGMKETQLNNYLPDLQGTNKTSSRDLAITLALIDNGNLLSARSRDLFREIMSTSKPNTLIPRGILRGLNYERKNNSDYHLSVKGYKVYNKTGDIGISYGDAALIQIPNNSRAVASFIVKGPFNDPRLPELIRELTEAATIVIEPI